MNGQWYKVIKGAGNTKRKPYYFGSWRTDPRGEHAIKEYVERLPGILAGTDHLWLLVSAGGVLTVGALFKQYLAQRKTDIEAGTFSKRTYGGYLEDLQDFMEWVKPETAVTGLCREESPAIFAAFVKHLIETRKLKSHSRRRVQASIKAAFRWAAGNGKCSLPNFGTAFKAPKTTKAALRQEKERLGVADNSTRIVTGEEIDKLLAKCKGKPQYRAVILLMANCGLGPADVGRLKWKHIIAHTMLKYPRPKTGSDRMGYIWKKTWAALERVKTLKHSKRAIELYGDDAYVFWTRRGLPYYREWEVLGDVVIDGETVKRVVSVRASNTIPTMIRRMTKACDLVGVTAYRFRHTFKTHGKKAKDPDALDLCMGHVKNTVGDLYDHEHIEFPRIKRVSLTVKRRLWPKPKAQGDTTGRTPTMKVADDGHDE
ncbi:MAG: site-specific integrase [Tepidisphaeraceae bacterium]